MRSHRVSFLFQWSGLNKDLALKCRALKGFFGIFSSVLKNGFTSRCSSVVQKRLYFQGQAFVLLWALNLKGTEPMLTKWQGLDLGWQGVGANIRALIIDNRNRAWGMRYYSL